MDPRLREAAQTGDFNYFYSLIEENASVLEDIDTESFAETPLHVAASAGQIAFAVEMMNLKPSFARTLNQAGLSPMHVALQNEKTLFVHRLLEMDKDLVRVKGREGKTPFHYAAELGEEKLLNEFLEACPECIQDVTVHRETALHISLKHNKLNEFKSLVRWIRESCHKDAKVWEERILNWKDEQGNTVLHIAAMENQPEAVGLLVKYRDVVDVNAKNSEDLTALEYISKCDENDESTENQEPVQDRSEITTMLQAATRRMHPFMAMLYFDKELMFSYLKRIITHISRRRKNISNDMRNALLVVITLIITATYQSSLSPPGGVWQGDNSNSSSKSNDASINTSNSSTLGGKLHDPGTTVMPKSTFSVFWTYNTLTLLTTLGLTAFLLPGGSIAILLLVPLSLLCSSYMLSMSILSPTPFWSKVNTILSIVFIMLLLLPYPRLFNERLRAQMKSELSPRAVLKSKKFYIKIFFCLVAAMCFTVIMLQNWLH
ncbi:PREDICTED: ankyrin repeat-containing protein At2g01680 [Theobroma cacao]|uniref:Ankyrin repeat-containing protein At2g01680 n=1 Tax=Theobroma cacao TaxID=3641 RepID=A0AB32X3B7_THECC|nr:PREDICTED: ankyrin repeat-containing protein At2g01680 [Theobroma cacao]